MASALATRIAAEHAAAAASLPSEVVSRERRRNAIDTLTAEGLRGRVVAVDFWTYSCVNWLRRSVRTTGAT